MREVSRGLLFEVSNWLPEYDPLVAPGVALEFKLPSCLVLRSVSVESPWWTYAEELLTSKDVLVCEF